MRNIIILLIIISNPSNIYSQVYNGNETNKFRKFTFSLVIGRPTGGPDKQVEYAMSKAGFDRTIPEFNFLGYTAGGDYPISMTGFPSFMASVKYYVFSPFSIDIFYHNTFFGETRGYHKEYSFLTLEYSVSGISATISLNVYDFIRFGFGPAYYSILSYRTSSVRENSDKQKHKKFGFLLDIGIRIPGKKSIFFELNTQYRFIGEAELGPYIGRNFPRTKINYSHLFLALGFGVRI